MLTKQDIEKEAITLQSQDNINQKKGRKRNVVSSRYFESKQIILVKVF